MFGVSIPFRFDDMRAPECINESLGALLEAFPALKSFRIAVTANTLDAG